MTTEPLLLRKAAAAFSDKRLELTILPTEQCNFRCTYCYEDFKLGAMSRPLIDGVKTFLTRRIESLEHLHVRWFGGEPLLAYGIIREVSEHVQALADRNEGLRYDASATTNGSRLTVERARALRAAGVVDYQVSIDGPKAYHDLTRLRLGGGGTYDQIMANLNAIRDCDVDVRIELRLHLTPDNEAQAEGFVDWLSQQFLHDERFTLEFFPVAKLGGPNDATMRVLDQNAGAELCSRLRQRAPARRGTVAEAGDRYVCYAAKGNAFLIRSDGSLAKCTSALSNSRNRIGQLKPDGTLEFDLAAIEPWLHGWRSGKWADLGCPLMNLEANLAKAISDAA
jgi:uncharacterized protein